MRLGMIAFVGVGALLLGSACDEEEDAATSVEAPTVDEVASAEPASEPEAIPEGEQSQGTDRVPLYATLGDAEEQVPVEAVVLEKGEAEGRLLFFRERVECEAVPGPGESNDTVISVLGVEPSNPEWVGATRTEEWWYMQDPEPIEGEGVEVELEELDGDEATGSVKVVSSDPARLFRLEGDFTAIVCSPSTP